MIKNYLLISLRSLMKNKLFILINVFGMGIAIACCVVAFVNWEFAHTWDYSQLNAEKIYRIQFYRDFQDKHERWGMAPMPMATPGTKDKPARWEAAMPPAAPMNIEGKTGPPRKLDKESP